MVVAVAVAVAVVVVVVETLAAALTAGKTGSSGHPPRPGDRPLCAPPPAEGEPCILHTTNHETLHAKQLN
jgi:hypothetical protein